MTIANPVAKISDNYYGKNVGYNIVGGICKVQLRNIYKQVCPNKVSEI